VLCSTDFTDRGRIDEETKRRNNIGGLSRKRGGIGKGDYCERKGRYREIECGRVQCKNVRAYVDSSLRGGIPSRGSLGEKKEDEAKEGIDLL